MMDYGKLAYLKVEELEQRLATLNLNNISYSSHLSLSLEGQEGSIPLASISGNGSVGIIAKISASGPVGKSILLVAGDLVVGETKLNGGSECFIIASVLLNGNEIIGLECDEGVSVNEVDIVFCGNAFVLARAIEVKVAALSDRAAFVTVTGKKVRLTVADASALALGLDPALGKVIGFGSCVDVVNTESGFALAWADKNTITLAETSAEGRLKQMSVIDASQVEDIAVRRGPFGYILAYIKEGKIIYRIVESDFFTVGKENFTGISADKLTLCGLETPYLIYTDRQKVFLKQFDVGRYISTSLNLISSVEVIL